MWSACAREYWRVCCNGVAEVITEAVTTYFIMHIAFCLSHWVKQSIESMSEYIAVSRIIVYISDRNNWQVNNYRINNCPIVHLSFDRVNNSISFIVFINSIEWISRTTFPCDWLKMSCSSRNVHIGLTHSAYGTRNILLLYIYSSMFCHWMCNVHIVMFGKKNTLVRRTRNHHHH